VSELGQPPDRRIAELARGGVELVAARGDRRHVDADVVLELGAVGGVEVDEQRRMVGVERAEQRGHLGGLGLDVVAIDVEPRVVGAKPHLHRAALVGPVVRAEPLVAVWVDHRDEHDVDGVERSGRDLAVEQIAQEPEPGVLALDLAGVDSGLEVDRRMIAAADVEREHRPALAGPADLIAAHVVVGPREVAAQLDRFVVAAGPRVLRGLGGGDQRRPWSARARGDNKQGHERSAHGLRYHIVAWRRGGSLPANCARSSTVA
jgi:hypothetical protein